MVLAPSEILVVFLEFAATTALLFVPVVLFVVGVDGPLASVAPDDSQKCTIEFKVEWHLASVR